VVHGNGSAIVSFTAGSDGGAAATYTVTSNPGGKTASGASPVTVTGLTNGTEYTFTVSATNVEGAVESSVSSAVTPLTTPDVPVVTSVVHGNGSAIVSFTAGSDGGAAATYTVTSNPGGKTATGASPVTVTGLTNGTEYTFTVSATNVEGAVESSVSSAVTPLTTPDAPTIVSATAGDGSATVSWSPSANNGGSNITGYKVVYSSGSVMVTTPATSTTISGLNNGTSYIFTVVATNAVGDGAASSSNSVTPISSQPTIDTALANFSTLAAFKASLASIIAAQPSSTASAKTSVDLSKLVISSLSGFTAPTSTDVVMFLVKDGEPVDITSGIPTSSYIYFPDTETSYTVTDTTGSISISFTEDGNLVFGGVTKYLGDTFTLNGQIYRYVAKGSAVGQAIPDAPTISTITGGTKKLSVYFTAPVSNGGSTITSYQYSTNGGSTWTTRSGTVSPIVITGLSDETTYQVQLCAVNANSYGKASVSSPGKTSAADSGVYVPCFFGNARVLTPTGYRRMDSLAEGDFVLTPAGSPVAIERVKKYMVAAGPNTNPYVVPVGQFGAERRVLISPDHKICMADGSKVKAKQLGLEQEDRDGMLTYYNLELTGQADMVVSGISVESLAHVRRVIVSMEQFASWAVSRYGAEALTPAVLGKIKRTCRLLADGRMEVPVSRRR
jgi:hypothetical protein